MESMEMKGISLAGVFSSFDTDSMKFLRLFPELVMVTYNSGIMLCFFFLSEGSPQFH